MDGGGKPRSISMVTIAREKSALWKTKVSPRDERTENLPDNQYSAGMASIDNPITKLMLKPELQLMRYR